MRKNSLVFSATLLASTLLISPAFAAGMSGLSLQQQDSIVLVAEESESNVQKGAENFIDNMTKRGIAFLSNPEMTQEQRKKEFQKLLNDSFDIKTIARFALGKFWPQATDAERTEYIKLFNTMIVEIYSNRFGEYQGQELQLQGSRPEGKKDALVSTVIVDKNSPEVKVDWRVRYNNGQYKVIDVIVEGVSMSVTQRSDFASVIQRGGGKIAVLLDHMRN